MSICTFKQFCEKHPAFPVGGLRHLRFHAKVKGFESEFVTVGRRVMTSHHTKFINIVKKLLLARADLTTATEIDHGRGRRLVATICYLRQRYRP